MAGFFWTIGPAVGGGQMMSLTIAGEVGFLQVTSSASSGYQVVAVPDFKPCIPGQTVEIGPVPLSFLPLTANGTGCVPAGQMPPMVPTATSQSPTDPNTTGPNPFCDALTHGGTVDTTSGGGGSIMTPQSPKELCDAAQNSAALSAARSSYVSACALLRRDQANLTAYLAVAAAAQGAAAGFTAAAFATGIAWYVALVFAILAIIFGAIAIAFFVLAGQAANDVGFDESLLDSAQKAWESAVAAVRAACCPAWITINTADLVCP
jgi:hypothetical protein